MPNKKNSSKPTLLEFFQPALNTWEAKQKALIKANLEAMKSQEEAKERARKKAMIKIHDWGTLSGRYNQLKTPKTLCHHGDSWKCTSVGEMHEIDIFHSNLVNFNDKLLLQKFTLSTFFSGPVQQGSSMLFWANSY